MIPDLKKLKPWDQFPTLVIHLGITLAGGGEGDAQMEGYEVVGGAFITREWATKNKVLVILYFKSKMHIQNAHQVRNMQKRNVMFNIKNI